MKIDQCSLQIQKVFHHPQNMCNTSYFTSKSQTIPHLWPSVCMYSICQHWWPWIESTFSLGYSMMTSSNRNIFRVTGHLCGEFTHRSPVNFPHKGQWSGALMFSLICTRINGWVNNRKANDLRRYRAHYDVIVMIRAILFESFHKGICLIKLAMPL